MDRVRGIFDRFKRPDDYPALTAPGYASRALPVSTEDLIRRSERFPAAAQRCGGGSDDEDQSDAGLPL